MMKVRFVPAVGCRSYCPSRPVSSSSFKTLSRSRMGSRSTLAMRGVPMGVIAEQLGHADTRMTEKHYAHLAPSYVADTIRANFPTLGIAGETTVTAISRRSGRPGRLEEVEAAYRRGDLSTSGGS